MKTLAKGVSGLDLGGPPLLADWPPLKHRRRVLRTILNPTWFNDFQKLRALPLAEGEGVRSTLLHHKVTRSQGHKIARSQGHKITISQCHKVTRLQGHKVTRSQGHKVTRSQGHKVTKSQGHKVTKSQSHNLIRDT